MVNDEVISARDLNDRLELVMLTSGIPDSEQARARLAPQVLRSLIEESLQLQEAERLDIEVEESEIEHALNNIAQRNQHDRRPDAAVLRRRTASTSTPC